MKNFVKISLIIMALLLLVGCGAEEESESEGVGYFATEEELSSDIPDYLIGDWFCTQGLPEELVSYELIIDASGEVTQIAVDTTGAENIYTEQCKILDDQVVIVDSDNLVLLTFYYRDGSLITENLSAQPAIFTKS